MSRLQANLLLLAAALLWGVGTVAQKIVLGSLGPFTALGLRGLIGTAVVLPFVLCESRAAPPLPRGLRRGMLAAAGAFCLAMALQQVGLLDTSVTNAGFLVETTVVFTPWIAWAMLRERPGPLTWPTIAVALLGIGLMGGTLDRPRWGDALCLGSAVVYSVWIVLVAGVARGSDRPFALAATQFAVTGLVGTGIGAAAETTTWAGLAQALPALLVLGGLATGAAFTLSTLAQRATPATDAAVLMSTEAVFGALAAAALLDERLTPLAGLGAALILLAVLAIQIAPASARAGTALVG